MDENVSANRLLGPSGSRNDRRAPFINHLARRCASATHFYAITHPSHPNYMAATAGFALRRGHTSKLSIFDLAQRRHLSWKVYAESMPRPCSGAHRLRYSAGRNPAVFFRGLAATCKRNDVPMGKLRAGALHRAIAGDRLASYTWITPNTCHNMHWAPPCHGRVTRRISAGDAWLHRLIPRLTAMPSYRAGRTLILLTWDEGRGKGEHIGELCSRHRRDQSCHVAMIAVSPYVTPRTRARRTYTHYSLLRTTERALGIGRYLGRAGGRNVRALQREMGF